MSTPPTLSDTTSATSLPELAVGQSHSDLRCGQTIDLFGQEAAPASPSQARGSKKAKQTSATSGQFGRGSSESAALQAFMESKLRQLLPTAGGMMWPMTWKEKATPLQRQYCQLAVSARRTKETDSGLWQTPSCVSITERSKESMARRKKWRESIGRKTVPPGNLAEQVAMWPTSNGSLAQTESKGQLNPAFVCWLMGYSTEHLSSMVSAMQSYRPLQRRSSKQQTRKAGE